jgi:putative ABC transport system permease protein
MTTTLDRPPSELGSGEGGLAARRAVVRWARRLFRREWRQQLLILALVTVATAATVVGAAVAADSPPPADAGFGTAQWAATFTGSDPHLTSDLAALEQRVGRTDVIENESRPIPGTTTTYDLRAQNPRGAYGQPMLSLLSGRYPTRPDQVAITRGLASTFDLAVGDTWNMDGTPRHVVGIVQNPQSLLDEFALVVPGQVVAPTQVTVLFDADPNGPVTEASNVQPTGSALQNGFINPNTIVLLLATVGMVLIGLVAVGGFTVLAQRRMRAIGMLEAVGATDRDVRLVVRANGVVVGVVGALLGTVLGLVAWFAYRPTLQSSSHHVIGAFQIPWAIVGAAIALAVVATYLAASRPARAVTKVPIVAALSGRPSPPKQVHRSAVPGVMLLVIAAFLFYFSGERNGNGGGAPALLLGFVVLTTAVLLLAPLLIAPAASLARKAPIATRMALRDMARYRSRSGSSLGAISLSVLIAVVICVVAAARYSDVLDYTGPNLAPNQLVVYADTGPGNGATELKPGEAPQPASAMPAVPSMTAQQTGARAIASAVGAHSMIELESTNANLVHAAPGRNYNGPLFVATPALLHLFGIDPSTIDPSADVLTMRPGLAGLSEMQLAYFSGPTGPGPVGPNSSQFPCPAGQCLANPVIQTVTALPSGTSAPNTVLTERAVHRLGLQVSTAGWLLQSAQPLTASQIAAARRTAAAAGLTIETKSDAPSSWEVLDWATAAGILLVLGIVAMSVGLIRSETANDLRTLTATGASRRTRRALSGATAGSLALLGAVVGTAAAYVACLAWFQSGKSGQGISSLASVPLANLALIVVGLPLLAAAGGWLFAGREPRLVSRQPLE